MAQPKQKNPLQNLPQRRPEADERLPTKPLQNLSDMRGVLFRNLKKEKPTHSDFYGEILVDGYGYWTNGWIHTATDGHKYIALQFKAKPDDRPVEIDTATGEDDFLG